MYDQLLEGSPSAGASERDNVSSPTHGTVGRSSSSTSEGSWVSYEPTRSIQSKHP